MQFLDFVPGLAVVPLEMFFVYKATANRNRAFLLTATPVAKVAELRPGPAQVRGWVVAFSAPLSAPLSGARSVYYHFRVEEKRTVRHGPFGASSHWKTVIDDVQSIGWGVDDGTGAAGLDLRKAELVLGPGIQLRTGFWHDTPDESPLACAESDWHCFDVSGCTCSECSA